MERIVIDKQTEVKENKIIITETSETRMNRENLELQLRDVNFRKERLKEQNKRLIEEYREVEKEEREIEELIVQLSDEDLEVI